MAETGGSGVQSQVQLCGDLALISWLPRPPQTTSLSSVSTVAEVEKALRKMPVPDARAVATWLEDYLADKWDRQIDEDIAAGRLDKLADRALADYRAGKVKPLDEILDQP